MIINVLKKGEAMKEQKLTVTAVAPVQILLAVTCKVSHLVAFVALLATSAAATTTASELTVPWSSWTAAASANVLAIAGIMSRPVTLEARISRHFVVPLELFSLLLD